ncbi:hypothetical protein C8J56DRAFT_1091875 [Mycena floridula]|nr:hypothetical protein C8J56DRAFT_1091875 [Mycena floridula]
MSVGNSSDGITVTFQCTISIHVLSIFRILYPLAYVIFQLPFNLIRSSWVVFEGWFLEIPSIFEDPPRPPGYLEHGLQWMVTNFSDNVGLVKNILHCIDLEATIQDPLKVPVASYATGMSENTPNLATFLYLYPFCDDPEMARLSVELFVQCVEEEGELDGWSESPAPLSDAQADRLLAVVKMKIKSQHFNRDVFQGCINALSVLWNHGHPNIQTSITDILHTVVQRIEKGPAPDSEPCFEGYVWNWFDDDQLTLEFISSTVFRDFFLWEKKKAIDPGQWESGHLKESIPPCPDGHQNMFFYAPEGSTDATGGPVTTESTEHDQDVTSSPIIALDRQTQDPTVSMTSYANELKHSNDMKDTVNVLSASTEGYESHLWARSLGGSKIQRTAIKVPKRDIRVHSTASLGDVADQHLHHLEFTIALRSQNYVYQGSMSQQESNLPNRRAGIVVAMVPFPRLSLLKNQYNDSISEQRRAPNLCKNDVQSFNEVRGSDPSVAEAHRSRLWAGLDLDSTTSFQAQQQQSFPRRLSGIFNMLDSGLQEYKQPEI